MLRIRSRSSNSSAIFIHADYNTNMPRFSNVARLHRLGTVTFIIDFQSPKPINLAAAIPPVGHICCAGGEIIRAFHTRGQRYRLNNQRARFRRLDPLRSLKLGRLS